METTLNNNSSLVQSTPENPASSFRDTADCPECGYTTITAFSMGAAYAMCPICGCQWQKDGTIIKHGNTQNPNSGGNTGGDDDGDDEDDKKKPDDWEKIWADIMNNLGSLGGMLGDPSAWIKQFYALMNMFHDVILGNDDNLWDNMTHQDQRNFINQIVQQYYNFISAMYQNYYSQEMWMLQQKYNSPLEQAQRLADAGLFNGFGNQITTGNAEQPSGSASIEQASPYQDKGNEINQQKRANTINAISAAFGALGSVASASSGFASVYATFAMTPVQRAAAIAGITKTKAEASFTSVMTALNTLQTISNIGLGWAQLRKDYFTAIGNWNNAFNIASGGWQVQREQMQNNLDVADKNGMWGYANADLTSKRNLQGVRETNRTNSEINQRTLDQQKALAIADIQSRGFEKVLDMFEKTSTLKTREVYTNIATGAKIYGDLESYAEADGLVAKAGAKAKVGGAFEVGGNHYVKSVETTKELNTNWQAMGEALTESLDLIGRNVRTQEDEEVFNRFSSRMLTAWTRAQPQIADAQAEEATRSFRVSLEDIANSAHKYMPKDSAVPMKR